MTELDHRRLDCAHHDVVELLEAEIAKGATVDAQVKYARTVALNTVPRTGRFSGRPSQVCSRGIWNLHGIHSILSAVKVAQTSGCYSRSAIKISPPLLVNGAKEFDFCGQVGERRGYEPPLPTRRNDLSKIS
jgi:hypothetical protein